MWPWFVASVWPNIVASVLWTTPALWWHHRKIKKHVTQAVEAQVKENTQ
jgi:hypothetical protein